MAFVAFILSMIGQFQRDSWDAQQVPIMSIVVSQGNDVNFWSTNKKLEGVLKIRPTGMLVLVANLMAFVRAGLFPLV